MNIPKDGSKWIGHNHLDVFRVLHTVELDGHMWIHYRQDSSAKEYSCYLESFLSRFSETVN